MPDESREQDALVSAAPTPDDGGELAALVDGEPVADAGESLPSAGGTRGSAQGLHADEYRGVTLATPCWPQDFASLAQARDAAKLYEFVRQGPDGEKIGTVVEGRDVKMNGLITKSGKFIDWSYLRVKS
jgi:hypothetical protein